ncbi:DUF2628 domain-containing protein [Paucisalibacillus globulus]|uniref:DUF2628 domain-containing protein n=1 Tax=Paucisalibacillus globulus TaxID=351095 RepID=UPI0003FBC6B8|nr:DUF2628 domain-containing protein [Paucisalibacillus globulus]
MYCIHCGKKQIEEARFCFSCGKQLVIGDTYEGKDFEVNQNNIVNKGKKQIVDVPMSDEELLVEYVGKYKANYYTGNWTKGKINWNWAAFFLTIFWVGYRRMYGFIFGLHIFYILLDLALQLLGVRNTVAIDVGIGAALSIFLGMNGNNMYQKHAQRKVKKLKRKYGEKVGAVLKISSGPSWGGFFLSLAVFIVYGVITFAIFYLPPITDPEPQRFYTIVEEYEDAEGETVVEDSESGDVVENAAEYEGWDDVEDGYYHELVAPSLFDFTVSKEIDINFDGINEIVTLSGGPVLDDPYLNDQVYISVRFGDVEMYEKVQSEGDSSLMLYDVNGDGLLELLYENSGDETLIDIFQVDNEKLEFVRALPGRLVELDTNRIMTENGEYWFEEWWWE